MKLGDKAYLLATRAHAGQKDKGGEAYMKHPTRVAAYVEAMGGSDEAIAVAYLHDVVEDTSVTLHGLTTAGFSLEVVVAVDALSRREGETYKDYILRLSYNPIAVLVKRADWLDNLNPDRLAKIDPEDAERLIYKMTDAQRILGIALVNRAAGL